MIITHNDDRLKKKKNGKFYKFQKLLFSYKNIKTLSKLYQKT